MARVVIGVLTAGSLALGAGLALAATTESKTPEPAKSPAGHDSRLGLGGEGGQRDQGGAKGGKGPGRKGRRARRRWRPTASSAAR